MNGTVARIGRVLATAITLATLAALAVGCQSPMERKETHSVTYDGNGANTGSAPADNAAYATGASVVILANTGNLYRSNFAFGGWNMKADGTGTNYAPGSALSMGTANITLYAVWIPTRTVAYIANGAMTGTAPVDGKDYQQGAVVTVMDNVGVLARSDGYLFAGWNSHSDGSGTSYAAGATFTMGASNVTLYGLWIPDFLTVSASGMTITVAGHGAIPAGTLTIPAGLTAIGNGAFSNCGFTGVTIPSTVTAIGDYAFSYSGLASVTIPSSVRSVGASAFILCMGLTGVSIQPGVNSLGDEAFWECSGLTSVEIPSSVTSLGGGVFGHCTGLTTVVISASIPNIPLAAFTNCTSLTSVALPSTLVSIDRLAFANCRILSSIAIPSGVTTIGESAFSSCAGLSSVTLPPDVASIGPIAFLGCTSLSSVLIQAVSPPTLPAGSRAFDFCASGLLIHVPSGAVDAYKGAAGWSDYSSRIVSP
jgi:BspA type Leucine rich repeat region (6 copies)/Listeria-Bacteroides repeat domain (List_Bact_rpt)